MKSYEMVLISNTARQHGFGTHPYKWVSHLTPAERAHVKAGGMVVFRSRPAGGNHGTTWRMALSIRGGKLVPRVPPPSVVAVLEADDACSAACSAAGFTFAMRGGR